MKESETTTTLPLTMPEPEVEKSNPWVDDKLELRRVELLTF